MYGIHAAQQPPFSQLPGFVGERRVDLDHVQPSQPSFETRSRLSKVGRRERAIRFATREEGARFHMQEPRCGDQLRFGREAMDGLTAGLDHEQLGKGARVDEGDQVRPATSFLRWNARSSSCSRVSRSSTTC